MKKLMTSQELARDSRFKRVGLQDRALDRRMTDRQRDELEGKAPEGSATEPGAKKRRMQFSPDHPDAPDRARSMMHGIFVGEIQALEGAGRTCWDFEVGKGKDDVPFELKLDMARQCWDESRHCEISVKLSDWMGTEIGEYGESAFLFEAACNPDPILRLTGVNRALEGLAIDVFNTMKEFGDSSGDPVLEFCEDWMLADEVTHVKMGSDWLRKITENDPERRTRALEFQKIVDKLFSGGGFRGDDENSPIRLARRFRELAGFDKTEIDEIAQLSKEALDEAKARLAASAAAGS
jgi:uncharacterized ferritin-like protein (DUF455 family)